MKWKCSGRAVKTCGLHLDQEVSGLIRGSVAVTPHPPPNTLSVVPLWWTECLVFRMRERGIVEVPHTTGLCTPKISGQRKSNETNKQNKQTEIALVNICRYIFASVINRLIGFITRLWHCWLSSGSVTRIYLRKFEMKYLIIGLLPRNSLPTPTFSLSPPPPPHPAPSPALIPSPQRKYELDLG